MFLTRLTIAALSLGAATRVLAMPIPNLVDSIPSLGDVSDLGDALPDISGITNFAGLSDLGGFSDDTPSPYKGVSGSYGGDSDDDDDSGDDSTPVPDSGVKRRSNGGFSESADDALASLQSLQSQVDDYTSQPGYSTDGLIPFLNEVSPIISSLTDKLNVGGRDKRSLSLEDIGTTITSVLKAVECILTDVKGAAASDVLQGALGSIRTELNSFNYALEAVLPEVHAIVGTLLTTVIGLVCNILDTVSSLVGKVLDLGL